MTTALPSYTTSRDATVAASSYFGDMRDRILFHFHPPLCHCALTLNGGAPPCRDKSLLSGFVAYERPTQPP